jgi:hypothetical protein
MVKPRIAIKPLNVVALAARLEREPDFDVDVVDSTVEISTHRPVGAIMAAMGPAVDAVVSFDQVAMPLRVLFHKLVSGEIEGQR